MMEPLSGSAQQNRPTYVDRIVVHQFDPATPSPGGIDTCLRGIARYLPDGVSFAFVGVDAGRDVPGRKLGVWEQYDRGSGTVWFLPVTKLDPGNQKRLLPHSLRVVLGVFRYYRRLPRAEWLQAHRMDTAWSLRRLLGKRLAYFVHTQENGLTGQASDSFWKLAGKIHRRLEHVVVKDAEQVVVFNDQYSRIVRSWNPVAKASPTWFDPDLITRVDDSFRRRHSIIWVGRLEIPKDPLLAVGAFMALLDSDPDGDWRLDIVGSGTLGADLEGLVESCLPGVGSRVVLHGRTSPARVAELMGNAGVFLMTSQAGYEGYPRVLVEALASGLPAVVTHGADTGNLVREAVNGYVTSRDPCEIAEKIRAAAVLPRDRARESVKHLSAPEVIQRVFGDCP